MSFQYDTFQNPREYAREDETKCDQKSKHHNVSFDSCLSHNILSQMGSKETASTFYPTITLHVMSKKHNVFPPTKLLKLNTQL